MLVIMAKPQSLNKHIADIIKGLGRGKILLLFLQFLSASRNSLLMWIASHVFSSLISSRPVRLLTGILEEWSSV